MSEVRIAIVEAIIKDSSGRILLMKRSKNNKFFVNRWQLPGGKVDFGENVQKAIKREIKEETGLTTSELKLEKIYSVNKPYGLKGRFALLIYSAEAKGKLILSSDHTQYKYSKLSDIKKSQLTLNSRKALFD